MHEYATRFADLLEEIAERVRTLTVDRISRYITLTALGILAAGLALTTLVFLVWTIFGALEIPLTTAGAFAVLGAALVVGGAVLWSMKSREE